MYVPMELSRVQIMEFSGEQYIFLREKGGQRTFPIVIGINEAMAIDRRLKGVSTLRPMTHDLMATTIEALGGRLERIQIEDLRQLDPNSPQQTFIATIFVRQGEQTIQIDSRPSDAIALGVASDTPIFVAQQVLDNVLHESPERRIEVLKDHQRMLGMKIEELSKRLSAESFTAQAPPEVIEKAREHLDRMKSEYEAIQRVLKMLG
jgi:hypothetical protein